MWQRSNDSRFRRRRRGGEHQWRRWRLCCPSPSPRRARSLQRRHARTGAGAMSDPAATIATARERVTGRRSPASVLLPRILPGEFLNAGHCASGSRDRERDRRESAQSVEPASTAFDDEGRQIWRRLDIHVWPEIMAAVRVPQQVGADLVPRNWSSLVWAGPEVLDDDFLIYHRATAIPNRASPPQRVESARRVSRRCPIRDARSGNGPSVRRHNARVLASDAGCLSGEPVGKPPPAERSWWTSSIIPSWLAVTSREGPISSRVINAGLACASKSGLAHTSAHIRSQIEIVVACPSACTARAAACSAVSGWSPR